MHRREGKNNKGLLPPWFPPPWYRRGSRRRGIAVVPAAVWYRRGSRRRVVSPWFPVTLREIVQGFPKPLQWYLIFVVIQNMPRTPRDRPRYRSLGA
jgi:hypothetical protein